MTLKGHLPALDGVRGLAILMVLGTHFIADARADTPFEAALTQVFSYGQFGVDLFFVLSGFLITGILYDSKGTPHYFRNFYMRRLLRIFPLYYGVLVLGLWVVPLFWRPAELERALEHQAWLWTYCANVFVGLKGDWEALPFFSHFWSLAVEEHFYFVWPLLVFWTHGPRTKFAALALAAGALGIRLAMVLAHVNPIAVYALTPGRLDALGLGAFVGLYAREPGGFESLVRWAPRALLISAGAIVVSFGATRVWVEGREVMHQVRQTGFSVCFCAVLLMALAGPGWIQGFFRHRVMTFFGKYSYGLYVFHFLFGYWLIRHRTEDVVARWVGSHTLAIFVQALMALGLSVLVSLASYHGFEKPFLNIKRRFEAPTSA